LAQDTRIKKITAVLSAAQQTFGVLYYPNKNGIQNADFSMEFKGNNYNGEDQIRKLLLEKQKLTDKTVDDTMRRKCEDRLFTRREMRLSEIKDRAATEMHGSGIIQRHWMLYFLIVLKRTYGVYMESMLKKDPLPKTQPV
jgi:hypothetical protein